MSTLANFALLRSTNMLPPLFLMVIQEQFEEENILALMAQSSFETDDHCNILHYAVTSKNYDTVKCILSHKESLTWISSPDIFGETPLHWACREGTAEIVNLLIKQGAEVHRRDNYGKTPLQHATAIDDTKIVMALLENGAILKTKTRFRHFLDFLHNKKNKTNFPYLN